ncbi:reductive dehalogenase [Muricauda sp. SCSIO 64092]|uniref:reductive dehalogenase n=1 Tax=Allomuricauda sp. SCSIO 64092 TaxID=2908842 RepID=UPI001FF42806|nr:reductive dehalogenase [Muricauda sp. SCSIO 64092]UOY08289.1 reductive dehalogenase [Muricauda sp. SCSIO 64092]
MGTANNSKETGRRAFLKKATVAGLGTSLVGTGIANLSGEGNPLSSVQPETKKTGKKSFSLFRKEYETIDDAYEISPDYQRMDQKNIIFGRWGWDPKYYKPGGRGISFLLKDASEVPNPNEHLKGYGPVEHALGRAAWAGHDEGAPLSNSGLANTGPLNDWDKFSNPKRKEPYIFESLEEAKKYVKRAALFLGADEVGIAPYDERWVYTKQFDVESVLLDGVAPEDAPHEEIKFPFEVKSVIAFTFEMDYDALRAQGGLSDASAALEYSHMTEVSHKVAVFLNQLGYKAIPAGNDVGVSIPIAIQAGLGEISRMGTLISEKHGSRVRLAKVFTDLELPPDKPISFGVQDFCVKCKKCAEACPSNAISLEDEPSLNPEFNSISSNPGVKKWYQNNERCFSQWEKMGVACGVCLTVCPYNKIDNWVHFLSEMVVSAPVGRDIARQLDDAFGYGKLGPQYVDAFWNKED